MSTGLNCEFVEPKSGEWYYILEDWNAPKQAWDWRDFATAYGPFASEEEANEHLRENHANPGGAEITSHDIYAEDETYLKLFQEAAERAVKEASRRSVGKWW